jgi:hypothetical protein
VTGLISIVWISKDVSICSLYFTNAKKHLSPNFIEVASCYSSDFSLSSSVSIPSFGSATLLAILCHINFLKVL